MKRKTQHEDTGRNNVIKFPTRMNALSLQGKYSNQFTRRRAFLAFQELGASVAIAAKRAEASRRILEDDIRSVLPKDAVRRLFGYGDAA